MQLYGLEADIHINDTQYGICLTVFFFSYAIFEVSNSESHKAAIIRLSLSYERCPQMFS